MCDSSSGASDDAPRHDLETTYPPDPRELHGIMFAMLPPVIVGGTPQVRFSCACGWNSKVFKPRAGTVQFTTVGGAFDALLQDEETDELVAHLVGAAHPKDADAAAVITIGVRAVLPALLLMAGRITNLTAALQVNRGTPGAPFGGLA